MTLVIDHKVPESISMRERGGVVGVVHDLRHGEGGRMASPFNLSVVCANCHARKSRASGDYEFNQSGAERSRVEVVTRSTNSSR